MKTRNYLFILTILLGIFIYSCSDSNIKEPENESSLELQSRSTGIGESCLGETPAACYDGVYSWPIVIPDYPNCEFIVTVDYYTCIGLGGGRVHFGDFDYVVNIGCNEFYDDWDDAIQNGTEDQFYTHFNQQIWQAVTLNLLNVAPLSLWQVAQIEYNVGSCIYLCEREALRCGDACCQKTNIWERNKKGDWELTEEGDITLIGDACPDDPISFCPGNVLQSGICFDNCASLDF